MTISISVDRRMFPDRNCKRNCKCTVRLSVTLGAPVPPPAAPARTCRSRALPTTSAAGRQCRTCLNAPVARGIGAFKRPEDSDQDAAYQHVGRSHQTPEVNLAIRSGTRAAATISHSVDRRMFPAATSSSIIARATCRPGAVAQNSLCVSASNRLRESDEHHGASPRGRATRVPRTADHRTGCGGRGPQPGPGDRLRLERSGRHRCRGPADQLASNQRHQAWGRRTGQARHSVHPRSSAHRGPRHVTLPAGADGHRSRCDGRARTNAGISPVS
jgi:hypothetical protein